MDSDEEYEFDIDVEIPADKNHANRMEEKGSHSSSTSENGDDYDGPPVLSPIHAMDIPSVRRPPVSAMIPADRVSAHDLPLADTLSAAEGGLFHNANQIYFGIGLSVT